MKLCHPGKTVEMSTYYEQYAWINEQLAGVNIDRFTSGSDGLYSTWHLSIQQQGLIFPAVGYSPAASTTG